MSCEEYEQVIKQLERKYPTFELLKEISETTSSYHSVKNYQSCRIKVLFKIHDKEVGHVIAKYNGYPQSFYEISDPPKTPEFEIESLIIDDASMKKVYFLGQKLICLVLCLLHERYPDVEWVVLYAADNELLEPKYEGHTSAEIKTYVTSHIDRFKLIKWYTKLGFKYSPEIMTNMAMAGRLQQILRRCSRLLKTWGSIAKSRQSRSGIIKSRSILKKSRSRKRSTLYTR